MIYIIESGKTNKQKRDIDMTFHEFGKDNEKIIILIHPSIVMWDYFEYVIPLLKLFIIFPAASALAAWICTLFQ